jgi:hypothetical protein
MSFKGRWRYNHNTTRHDGSRGVNHSLEISRNP